MDAINITSARKDLYNLVAGVNVSHRPVTITSKTGNAVLISDEDWKDIEETLYLLGVPGLAQSIRAAAAEPLEEGTAMEDIDWNEV